MDRLNALCAMDRHMLQAFSQRTAAGLARHRLFGLLLPAFQSFLDINVRKEVEKDRRVLATAAAALKTGNPPGAADAQRLLSKRARSTRRFSVRPPSSRSTSTSTTATSNRPA